MFGRPVHIGQTVTAVGGVQAQVQELGINGTPTISGVISERTHFVFRSRSARIIWLVQISSEMWEYDQNGDLYFEKFLNQFADPLFDRWKSLGVTHSLTVVFFARTLYLDGVDPVRTPNLCCKASLQKRSDGVLYQDFFKVVLENSSEVDKVAHLRVLKKEFWAFPKNVGWNIEKNRPDTAATGTYTPPSSDANEQIRPIAVPSDALNGNVLEAINTTLNLLDKHYIDRDLLRTGNSIVMISAGVGMFKVKPTIALISKQRMMDTGIGLDFISLSQPPLHFVPLFLFCCSEEGLGDFYVVPQWINVCYVDCVKDSSATVENATNIPTLGSAGSLVENNSKVASRSYLWTGLEEYGGVITSNRNKDKEVERVYHNIHSISNNGGNNITMQGDVKGQEYLNVDRFIWGEGFTPQPFSSILKGHLHGKSGFAPSPLGPFRADMPIIRSPPACTNLKDKGGNLDYRSASYYEERSRSVSCGTEEGHESCINIFDVERNKSLVHAYSLPAPLKRALTSQHKIVNPEMNIVTAAIETFAFNVKHAWKNDDSDEEILEIPNATEEVICSRDVGPRRALNVPQWGYFSFQEASKAISRLPPQFSGNGSSNWNGNGNVLDRRSQCLDYDNDEEFKLLKDRSVSFSDEGYCNDGLRNSYGAHIKSQMSVQNFQNNTSHYSQYNISKRETLKKESDRPIDMDRDGDRAGSSYSMVSFVHPSSIDTQHHGE